MDNCKLPKCFPVSLPIENGFENFENLFDLAAKQVQQAVAKAQDDAKKLAGLEDEKRRQAMNDDDMMRMKKQAMIDNDIKQKQADMDNMMRQKQADMDNMMRQKQVEIDNIMKQKEMAQVKINQGGIENASAVVNKDLTNNIDVQKQNDQIAALQNKISQLSTPVTYGVAATAPVAAPAQDNTLIYVAIIGIMFLGMLMVMLQKKN
jgi:hypothetical protein